VARPEGFEPQPSDPKSTLIYNQITIRSMRQDRVNEHSQRYANPFRSATSLFNRQA
jgi:hypothetical protein